LVYRMSSSLCEIKEFRSPYAPSLIVLAAKLKAESTRIYQGALIVSGKGFTREEAETRLFGEAAETDALFMRSGDIKRAIIDPTGQRETGFLNVQDILCANPDDPDYLGSSGCAAHNMFETAACIALNELIERRAILAWWQREIPAQRLAKEWLVEIGLGSWLRGYRKGAQVRRLTKFYQLGDGAPLQTVAAVSVSSEGGEIAIAYAAGATVLGAAKRAFLELLTVELETSDLQAAYQTGQLVEPGSNRALVALRQKALAISHADLFDDGVEITPDDGHKLTSLLGLIEACNAIGEPINLVDITRPEVGLPVCRAMYQDRALQPHFPGGNKLSPL